LFLGSSFVLPVMLSLELIFCVSLELLLVLQFLVALVFVFCCLYTFDFNYSAGITKPQMKQLRELVWLEQNYNVVLMGPSGVGKSFIALGLVYEAAKQGYRACFYTMEDIINIIRLKDLSSLALAAYTKLMKVHLLAIEDMMLLPIKKD